MSRPLIRDLLQIVQKPVRYFYLQLGPRTRAIPIRRVEKDRIYVDAAPDLLALPELSGFLVLDHNLGILQITIRLNLNIADLERIDVLTLPVNWNAAQVVNRRNFHRLQFSATPCRLVDQASQSHVGSLQDISAGGLSVVSQESLPLDKVYLFAVDLPVFGEGEMQCAIQLIYEQPHPHQGTIYGAQFVTNPLITPHPVLTESGQRKIIQYINRVLVERHRMGVD